MLIRANFNLVRKIVHATSLNCVIGVCAALLVGCVSGPEVPAGWSTRTASDAEVASFEPTESVTHEKARLQILIGYGTVTSHNAVRLLRADGSMLMWDPGGKYGETQMVKSASGRGRVVVHGVAGLERRRDVVFRKVPSLPTYWAYRETLASRSKALGVYEWTVEPDVMAKLEAPLLLARASEGADDISRGTHVTPGTRGTHVTQSTPGTQSTQSTQSTHDTYHAHDTPPSTPRFETQTGGGACGLAVCRYLAAYGPASFDLDGRAFYLPTTTVRYLWQRDAPDRVLHYKRDGSVVLIEPNGR